jgi:hypothetical protein
MLELPVARPLPIEVPAVGLDELDDLADRHSVVRRGVGGIGPRLYGNVRPLELPGVCRLRRLTTQLSGPARRDKR